MCGVHEPPATALTRIVSAALVEDLEPLGDVSASMIDPSRQATGRFVARRAGVICGTWAVDEVAAQIDRRLTVTWEVTDGDLVDAGRPLGAIEGPLAPMLSAERTALNLLCHCSGVATATRRFVDAVAGRCQVLDTRKTTPGLRALEKAAVRAGGGVNHRGTLSEMVMLKDNHLLGLDLAGAVAEARRRWPHKVIQVECDRLDQVRVAVAAGADAVLLDNMGPAEIAESVAAVAEVTGAGGGAGGTPAAAGRAGRCVVEVSGGVDLDTVGPIADAGPDLVSVGAITHSAPALDIGLDVEVLAADATVEAPAGVAPDRAPRQAGRPGATR